MVFHKGAVADFSVIHKEHDDLLDRDAIESFAGGMWHMCGQYFMISF